MAHRVYQMRQVEIIVPSYVCIFMGKLSSLRSLKFGWLAGGCSNERDLEQGQS